MHSWALYSPLATRSHYLLRPETAILGLSKRGKEVEMDSAVRYLIHSLNALCQFMPLLVSHKIRVKRLNEGGEIIFYAKREST